MSKAYLLGALHDATEREYTYRVSQKHSEYVEYLATVVESFGFDAWTYREGSTRELYVVEFSKEVLESVRVETASQKRDYIRGVLRHRWQRSSGS